MHARPRTVTVAALLALGLGASASSAADYVPKTPTTEVFLTCGSPSKEYVVGTFVNDDEGTPTWDSKKPASVTTGAGCGKADEAFFGGTRPETPYQFTFRGTYTGNLDTLTVTLHTADLGPSRLTSAPVGLSVRATVDGLSLFGSQENESTTGDIVTSPADRPVTVKPVATGATGGVRALSFSITGLDLLLPADNTEHEILLDVGDTTLDNHAWMWGAAEAPSGVVFTPKALAAAKLKANKRATRK